jgi:glycosyltransferase involved in cell wall biosynthesis
MKNNTKITSLLITKNEEIFIRDFILSMDFVDEIIIVDSFSTDKTIDIIKEFPYVKLFQREFKSFSDQKNFAIEKASNNWILFFDTDEILTTDLKEEILDTLINKKDNKIAYWIKRSTIYMGKRIKYSGWQNDKVIRLFDKNYCEYNGNLVHEKIIANGEIGTLKNKIIHYSYKGFDKMIQKRNYYAQLQAQELYIKGVNPNIFHFTIKPFYRFLKHYIIKLGFLDGFRGFVISAIYAYSVFVRYVKLWLLININDDIIVFNDNPVKIDAVFTWVDGGDTNHIEKMKPYLSGSHSWNNEKFKTRFQQVNEIEHSIKSILKYAPYIKDIHIVTDNQKPNFLKNFIEQNNNININIIDHKDIFDNQIESLPVFNSMSIETKLYRIPNLSEHFVYFNDDFILLNSTTPKDFFTNGIPVLRGKWTKFDDKILYKVLHNKLLKALGKQTKDTKYGYKRGQQNAARLLGFKNKYLRINHTPTPMRKTSLNNFFDKNKDIEKFNAEFRFRNHQQFLIQSLANHLEIKNASGFIKQDFQLFFLSSLKRSLFWYKYKLKRASHNPNKLFLCVQSLDKAPKKNLDFMLSWLENRLEIK